MNRDTTSYIIVMQEKKPGNIYTPAIGLINSNSVLWENMTWLKQCGINQKHQVFL